MVSLPFFEQGRPSSYVRSSALTLGPAANATRCLRAARLARISGSAVKAGDLLPVRARGKGQLLFLWSESGVNPRYRDARQTLPRRDCRTEDREQSESCQDTAHDEVLRVKSVVGNGSIIQPKINPPLKLGGLLVWFAKISD
jgi:hypothetical protein